jgi:hypothetical protein
VDKLAELERLVKEVSFYFIHIAAIELIIDTDPCQHIDKHVPKLEESDDGRGAD